MTDGASVLITGASSDIGISACRLYLSKGYSVVGLYNRGQPLLSELADENEALTTRQVDFGDAPNVEEFIADDRDLIARSSVLVNAASLLEPIPYGTIRAEDFLKTVTINALPSVLLTQAVVPAMLERGWGRIVNISSIGVKFGGGNDSYCYAMTKHMMEFFPSAHRKWAARNVLINALRAGVVDTRIHDNIPGKSRADRVALIPMGRMATCDEIANVIYWMGSQENSYMTGQVMTVAGGE